MSLHLRSIIQEDDQEDDHEDEAIQKHYVDLLCRMVFGSNMIESAGASLEATCRMCKGIFQGQQEVLLNIFWRFQAGLSVSVGAEVATQAKWSRNSKYITLDVIAWQDARIQEF